MEGEQPLTPAGRLFLEPLTHQIILCALAVEFPIDVDAVRAEIQSSVLLRHPRFCSLLVQDACGRGSWRRTAVDVDRHIVVRRQHLSDDPSVSDEDAVNDYLADLAVSSPLPTDKPLWEIHLLLAHRTLVFRVHHALGDGISLMSMLLSCCRRADDPSSLPTIGGASTSRRRRSAWTLAMVVWYTLVHVLEFFLRALWVKDKSTAVSGGAGVELWPRKVATARFQLDDMKLVKRTIGDATINDVLFGIISYGLSRYLDIVSPEVVADGLRITGLAMINLRSEAGLQDITEPMNAKSGTRWGNKFGMLLLPIYYHRPSGSDPIQYVKRAKAMIDKKKLSLGASFSYRFGMLVMLIFGAKFASILNYRVICNTSFTMSNMVGPMEKIAVVGNPVKYLRVTSSSLPHAITMHMVSYAGMVELQILAAKEVIPDPKALARCFEDALVDMKVAAMKEG